MATYRMITYDGQRSPWLFHHVTTRRAHRAGQPIRDGFRTAFAKARERAELPEGFRPHDLRHRRITTWLADGGDVTKVKEAVGHASLATTMGYTHLAREHLRSLVEKNTENQVCNDLASCKCGQDMASSIYGQAPVWRPFSIVRE